MASKVYKIGLTLANIWFQSSNYDMTVEASVDTYDQARQHFDKVDIEFEKQLQKELAKHASHDFCRCEIGANSGGFKYIFKAVYNHETDWFVLHLERGEKKNVLGMIPVKKKSGKTIENLSLYEVFEYLKIFMETPQSLFSVGA